MIELFTEKRMHMLTAILILMFISSCASYQPPIKTDHSGKTGIKYKKAVKALASDLVGILKSRMNEEFAKRGPHSVIINYEDLEEKTEWNDFLEQFDLEIRNELDEKRIRITRYDLKFSDQIGNSAYNQMQCPENIDLPEVGINIDVSGLSDEITVTLKCTYLNSKDDFLHRSKSLSEIGAGLNGYDIGQRNKRWKENKIKTELTRYLYKGHKSNPYQDVDDVANFFARILKCKYEIANKIWNAKHAGTGFDFSQLAFRWKGIRNSDIANRERAEHLNNAICSRLKNTGLVTVDCDDGLQVIAQEIDSYQKNKKMFLKPGTSQEKMEFNYVPAEILIYGTLRPGRSNNRAEVSLNSVVLTSDFNKQGIIVPELGANCYISDRDIPPKASLCNTIKNQLKDSRIIEMQIQEAGKNDNIIPGDVDKKYFYYYRFEDNAFCLKMLSGQDDEYKAISYNPFAPVSIAKCNCNWLFFASSQNLIKNKILPMRIENIGDLKKASNLSGIVKIAVKCE
jgi:hypothetical protein